MTVIYCCSTLTKKGDRPMFYKGVMTKTFVLTVCLLTLAACSSSSTTEAIANSTIKDVKSISEAVERIEKQTQTECKTDALMSNLEALKSQAISITSQIKSIELSCTTEKQVLLEKITVRNVMIGSLLTLLAAVLFFFLRLR